MPATHHFGQQDTVPTRPCAPGGARPPPFYFPRVSEKTARCEHTTKARAVRSPQLTHTRTVNTWVVDRLRSSNTTHGERARGNERSSRFLPFSSSFAGRRCRFSSGRRLLMNILGGRPSMHVCKLKFRFGEMSASLSLFAAAAPAKEQVVAHGKRSKESPLVYC